MSRFDFIKYDVPSGETVALMKEIYQEVEGAIDERLSNSREKALALTALEESFMWIGKAIKNEQIIREAGGEGQPVS